jgi:hypothetical protein
MKKGLVFIEDQVNNVWFDLLLGLLSPVFVIILAAVGVC